MALKCLMATNCSNLLSQIATPKTYYGYECILDINNNFKATYITCLQINKNNVMVDIDIQQGACNQSYLTNTNPTQNTNDVRICFNVNQNLAKVQISYDQFFYLISGAFPKELGFVATNQVSPNYVDVSNITISQSQSFLQCQNNYYKTSEYQLYDTNPTSQYIQMQTYVHPGNFPNYMANVQIMVYYQCPIGCSACDSQGHCSACISNYNLNQQYCYLNCNNSNQYALVDVNSSQQSCQQCDPSCLTCFVASNSCTACANNYYPLYQPPSTTFNCYQTCPNNYYFSVNQCLKCDVSCSTCINDSKSCTQCSDTYYPLYTNQAHSPFMCYQTCPNNYYFSVNQCLQCDVSCSTCITDSKSCTQCSDTYYPLYTNQAHSPFMCYQTCPNNYYLSNNQCLQCDISCSTCITDSKSCTQCSDTYYPLYTNQAHSPFMCYQTCPSNYYFSVNQCLQCDVSCSTCITDSKSCTLCSDTYYPLYSNQANSPFMCYQTCPNNYYLSNNQCKQCDQSCLTCSGNSNTCTSCSNNYYPLITGQNSSTFLCYSVCPDNYFLKNSQCQKCDISCSTCTGDSKSCTSCTNSYIPLYDPSSQNIFRCYSPCPNGYELKSNQCQSCTNYNLKSCQSCDVTCNSCQPSSITNCLDCYPSMVFNNNKCTCKNSQDQRNIFYQCSYDKIAVIQATFAGDSPTLTLEFGSILKTVSNLQCSQVFDQATTSLLGTSSNCVISSTQIIVSLSSDAVIMVNSTIGFNSIAQVLAFQGYTNAIDTFYLMPVVQQLISTPSVNVQYNSVQNSCNDISFTIQNIQNDAKRGFLLLNWVLDQPQTLDASTLQNVNSIIQTANNQQSQSLVFNKYILPPDYTITIKLYYLLKVNQSNTLSFTTLNQFNKLVSIQIIQSKYPPIYRFMDLTIQFQFFVQICNQSGATITQEPLDIQIVSQAQPNLNQNYQKFNSENIQLVAKAYSIALGTSLDLKVQAALSSNNQISTTQNLSITPELSQLFIDIYGGQDRLVNYKSDYTLNNINFYFQVCSNLSTTLLVCSNNPPLGHHKTALHQNLNTQQQQDQVNLQEEPQKQNEQQSVKYQQQQSLQQEQQLIGLDKLEKVELTPTIQLQNMTEKEINEIIHWNINQEYDTQSARKKEINIENKSNKNGQILHTVNDNQSDQNMFQDSKDSKQFQQNKLEGESQSQKGNKHLQNTSFDQKIVDQENPVQKDDEIFQKVNQKPIYYQILIFHNFFSIFYINDAQISRPLRFSIFYLRVIHSLSISTIFNQQDNLAQMIIVSIINVTVISVSVAIIQGLYKLRKIAVISGQSESYSNQKIMSFIIIFGFDFLIVSSLTSLLSIFILKMKIKKLVSRLGLEIDQEMFPFIKRICVESLQDCLMMKKSQNHLATPHAKQSIQIQDDEKRKMANNVDQDDNLENDQDDDQFSTDWTTAPSTNNMVIAYESLNIEAVPPSQNKGQTKQSSQKVENMEKSDSQNKKKVTKMIGKLDEEKIITKQQDLLDQEPDYFEDLNKQQELIFEEPVVNKQKQQENQSNEKGRFQDDGALDDFNANGWVDDIEIEL
ncbi:hypothetical protein ABPG73_006225 [Tetrahymena malaccensis]